MGETQSVYLSIIIVSYNTKEVTRNCLSSIYQNPPQQPFEIIVVDNNSLDGSQAVIERNFPEVILIKNSENAGFAKANNQGIRISSGNYVLLLNPDTLVLPEAIDRMLAFMDKHPKVGAVTPRIWLDEGKTLQSHILHPFTMGQYIFGFTPLGKLFPHNGVFKKMWKKDIEVWRSKYPLEVDCFAGACIMIRRKAIDNVGSLDENFFLFFEDTDLCLRMKKAGWRLFFLPVAEIVHFAHQSPSDRLSEIYRNSLVYYLKKHYHWLMPGFLTFLFLFLKVISKIFSYFTFNISKEKETVDLLVSNKLHWPEVACAKGYILEISIDPTFTNKGGSIVENNSYEIPPEIRHRWPDGFYFWKAAPIYSNGNIGEFSPPKIFEKLQSCHEGVLGEKVS